MICIICKQNKAKFKIVEISQNKRRTLDLCKDCAEKYQDANFDRHFNSIKDNTNTDNIKCPRCKLTLQESLSKKEIGCEYCIKHFEDILNQILKDQEHKGKSPKKQESFLNKRDYLIELEDKLKSAIAREDFTSAQKIKEQRDKFLSDKD